MKGWIVIGNPLTMRLPALGFMPPHRAKTYLQALIAYVQKNGLEDDVIAKLVIPAGDIEKTEIELHVSDVIGMLGYSIGHHAIEQVIGDLRRQSLPTRLNNEPSPEKVEHRRLTDQLDAAWRKAQSPNEITKPVISELKAAGFDLGGKDEDGSE